MREELTPEFFEESDRKIVPYDVPVRDAATLLVMDRSGADVKVLTGVRKKTLAFMPSLTVFPGGGIEAQDKMPVAGTYPEDTRRRIHLRAALDDDSARALGRAALRETAEETGVEITSLQHLHLVARAITPPYRPRRFDTRFFMIDREYAARENHLDVTTDLEDIAWLSFDELTARPLAFITRQVLTDLAPLFRGETMGAFPFYYSENTSYFREYLA